MHIAMIGSGYVGLVSGACLADFGHIVTCVDKDVGKIAALQRGQMPIFEPGLAEIVVNNARQERLFFTTDLAKAVRGADAVFIAVGTPSRRGDGHADLTYVFDAAQEIAGAIEGFTTVVTKSTVPVGTGDEVERIIRETAPGCDVAVVSNPEFLREGAAINDFKRPDRIVVGFEDERARAVMSEVYRPLYLNQPPILFTARRTAELTKYAANAFLATKITFINEIADLCERTGANVQDVARGIGASERYLRAGSWPKGAYPLQRKFSGKKLGIVGLGRIGRAIARRGEAFGLKIAYHGRKPQADAPWPYYERLEDMAKACDILMVATPGGSATRNLIDARMLDALGPQGILINIARGSVVDEPALIAALREKRILTAGLDVFAGEPDVPAELIAMDHVALLPHVGSASHVTRDAMSALVVENVAAYAAGEGPVTPVAETPLTPGGQAAQ